MRATLAARWTAAAGWRALQANSALATAVACGALLLVLGAVYALFTPPFQVPDEPAHFFRAYELTEGYCKAPLTADVPMDILTLMNRFPDHVEFSENADDMNARLAAAHERPRSGKPLRISAADTAAGYSCLTYVPAAAGT